MCLGLYNGTHTCCGLTSSGGTESILLACLAYREWGKNIRGIKKPNIVAASTAHAAVDKACFLLQIELRKVPHKDQKYNIEGARKMVDKNTIMLYASCPEYAYGNFDPLP